MVADLSSAYADQATSVKRGIELLNGRKDVLLQDEIQMKSPGEFYWFMHTRADIQVTDNAQSAILTVGTKKAVGTSPRR